MLLETWNDIISHLPIMYHPAYLLNATNFIIHQIEQVVVF
jgi:hypothetical protein